MAIAIGGNPVNKAYLGTNEVQKMYLGSDLVFDNSIQPNELTPIMTNFRVNNDNKDRIYFDVVGDISGMNTDGFEISGKTISAVDTVNNYFTVDTPFTFWDQAITIRLGENSDTFNGVQVNPVLHNFTLDSVYNLIDEPTATVNRYVAVGGSGDGTSEGNAASLSTMETDAVAGQTWWIKAGDYGNTTLSLSKDGAVDNPIKYIGYVNTIGDITENYVANAEALRAGWSTAEFPTLTGVGDASGTGVTPNCDYVILRNFQTTQFREAVRNTGNITNTVIERFNSRDNVETEGVSTGFSLVDSIQTKITVRECFFLNHRMAGLATTGNSNSFNLFENNSVYKDSNLADQDYWVGMSGSNNIIRKNHGSCNAEISSSHGMGIKAGDSESDNNYNLIELNEAYGLAESYYLRNSSTYYNVVKDNYAEGISGGTRSGGFYFWGGTRHSIIERNKFKDLNANAIRLQDNAEGSVDEIGAYNILMNNIFDGAGELLVEASDATESLFNDNKFYNNTFMNIPNWSLWSAAPWDGVVIQNLEWTNNIFENIPSIGDGMSPGQIFTNNNFNGCWTNGLGTGDTNLDPQLDANYLPANESLTKPKLVQAQYDYDSKERAETTTIGGVTLLSENAGSTPVDADYYVSESEGLDTNPGTELEPWKTLAKSRDGMVEGNVIAYKRGDTWNELLNISSKNGTVNDNITLTAYGSGEKPIITAVYVYDLTWTSEGGNIWSTTEIDRTVVRLKIDGQEVLNGSEAELGTSIPDLVQFYASGSVFKIYSLDSPENHVLEFSSHDINTSDYYNIAMGVTGSSYLNFENIEFKGGYFEGINIATSDNISFDNCSIGDMCNRGFYVASSTNLNIINCDFDTKYTLDYSGGGTSTSSSRGGSDGIAIIELTNGLIHDNTFKNWGHSSYILTSNSQQVITNVITYNNNLSIPDLPYGGASGMDGLNTYGNEEYNNTYDGVKGIQFNGHDNHFHDNTVINAKDSPIHTPNTGEGIRLQNYYEGCYNNIIEDNIFTNCSGSGVFVSGNNSGDITGNIIRRNVITNCGIDEQSNGIRIDTDSNTGSNYGNSYIDNEIINDTETLTIRYRNGLMTVSDFNAANGGIENNTITGNTDGASPVTPGILSEGVVTSTSIELNWTEATSSEAAIQGYHVYRNGSNYDSVGNTLTYTATYDIDPNTTSEWKIFCFDTLGNEAFTNEISVSTPA